MKFSGRANRVLADHGVGDKKHFAGLQLFFQIPELVHQIIIDVQSARGVHQDDVAGGKFCFLDCATNNFQRFVRACAGPNIGVNRFCNLRELFAGGGTIHVSRNNDWPVAVLCQPFCEFAGGGGFTGTLQTNNYPDRWRARSKKRLGVFAEKSGELIANEFDDLLVGRKLQHNFAAERFAANAGEQFVNDRESDVAFEQGFANFSESRVKVLFGELALAAKIFECAL